MYPTELQTLSIEQWDKCYKGVLCPKCCQPIMKVSYQQFHCEKCHHKIYKSQAACQLYSQLCLLFHDQNDKITLDNIQRLSGNTISKETIRIAIANNFPEVYEQFSRKLKNIYLPYDKTLQIRKINQES